MNDEVNQEPSDRTDTGRAEERGWPPNFPHAAIDTLLERIEHAHELDPATATELLLLTAREAQRLRATVLRLSTARLSAAEQEAQAVVEEAHRHAGHLRELALETLERRLDESDRLLAAVRDTIRTDRRIGLSIDRRHGSEHTE